MEERPCLVSVLCTAYNHESYIRAALEGIVSQRTGFAFELLINDDLSTDGTADIIREYAARYPDIIRPFYQEKNLYSQDIDIYQTVFYPNARGKYVAFCEGDDYWTDPDKLRLQVDFLEAHPDYSGCVHNTMLHYCAGDREDEPLLDRSGDGDVRMENVIAGMSRSYHTSSLVAKTALLSDPPDFYAVAAQYGFGDYPDALWLMLHGPVRYLDRVMSVYRINSGESAWSSGVDWQYDKLRRFIIGRHEMLTVFRPHAPEEYLPLVDATLREQEFELMYIEGRDREQRRPPYREILRRQSLKYRLNNALKCLFPGLHRLYRRRRGYEDNG